MGGHRTKGAAPKIDNLQRKTQIGNPMREWLFSGRTELWGGHSGSGSSVDGGAITLACGGPHAGSLPTVAAASAGEVGDGCER